MTTKNKSTKRTCKVFFRFIFNNLFNFSPSSPHLLSYLSNLIEISVRGSATITVTHRRHCVITQINIGKIRKFPGNVVISTKYINDNNAQQF